MRATIVLSTCLSLKGTERLNLTRSGSYLHILGFDHLPQQLDVASGFLACRIAALAGMHVVGPSLMHCSTLGLFIDVSVSQEYPQGKI